MKRSDWLTVFLQIYGIFLVVSALLTVPDLINVFDRMGFGQGFLAMMKIGITVALGAGLFRFGPLIGAFGAEQPAGPRGAGTTPADL
jgi:hypothetical protein